MKHLKYLKYLIRHKWYVFLECCKFGVPWLGVVHDWSKFLPSEWFAYVNYFYGDFPSSRVHWIVSSYSGPTKFTVEKDFNMAWNHHQNSNKHHWQYWIWYWDDDDITEIIEMPSKYLLEMIADWSGAGWAKTGKDNMTKWYIEHKDIMKLAPHTKKKVESLIGFDVYQETKL